MLVGREEERTCETLFDPVRFAAAAVCSARTKIIITVLQIGIGSRIGITFCIFHIVNWDCYNDNLTADDYFNLFISGKIGKNC